MNEMYAIGFFIRHLVSDLRHMVEIWEANAHNRIILAGHSISVLLCKLLLHFRLTPSITPPPSPSYGPAHLTPPHIELLHPLGVPIFFFPSSLSLLGPVHTYPEILVSANFFMRIQKYLRPHVACTTVHTYPIRIRTPQRISQHSSRGKRLVLILWRQRIQKYTDTSVYGRHVWRSVYPRKKIGGYKNLRIRVDGALKKRFYDFIYLFIYLLFLSL